MEPEYETRADDVSANAANHQPSHRAIKGCNRRHPSLLRFGRPALGDERPELTTVQEVFSRAYKMLMKHKSLEKQLLDIPFNLCLLLKEKRPAFLIQADNRTAHLRASIDACLAELSSIFATIHTYQGQLVCLQSRAEEIRQTMLADGSCSCFGRILGYPFAGELDEIHCCEGRFRVNLKISTSDMELETGQAASFLAMVGCHNHCVSDVMRMSLDFQAVASEISPTLRVSFLVDLYNDDPRQRSDVTSGGTGPHRSHHAECSFGHVAPCHWPSQAGAAFSRRQPFQAGANEENAGSRVPRKKSPKRIASEKRYQCSKFAKSEPRGIEKVCKRHEQPCTVTPREREGWRMK
ncbi:hypothetical protein KFL_002940080 [Klebsormidium nitens]|uniref:Uncharacterized protein n=1 Tax=Klebsormidium nitens TaxID=105231 RepID=A0A1Y1I987_KLENI|nr:hypothetical protein KFL_002940080 [Klebsormidium nitens]|eukprot:GAQ86522.1 hypothetical protein KFL_002940080 [Klebsormidium nitens]